MNSSDRSGGVGDILAEDFAADVTIAAYRVALWHGVKDDSWIELQLNLWRAVADTVASWRRRSSEDSAQPEAVDRDTDDEVNHWSGARRAK